MIGSVRNYPGRGWVVQFYDPKAGKKIFKTFKLKEDAETFQASLVVRRKEGSLDSRDYAKSNPLGFRNQAETWLSYRKAKVRDIGHLQAHMAKAIGFFGGDRNIKEIGFAELEDFLHSLPEALSSKTRKNIFITLHAFLTWFAKRERGKGYVLPEFPVVKFTLGWRKTVEKETQAAIVEEVKRISYHKNPRVWFAIATLANFPKVRPGELIQVKEQDIDRKTGEMWIRHTKEGKEKRIYLLDEDLAFINSLPQGFPEMPFFRHGRRKGVGLALMKSGGQFGRKCIYSWWMKACKNLGIKGVDLYGGTKHSTVTAAREIMTPEEIRKYLTGHATNAAFDRYLQVDAQKQREASTAIRKPLHTSCIHEKQGGVKAKLLKLRG